MSAPTVRAWLAFLSTIIVLFSVTGESPASTSVARAADTGGTTEIVSLHPSVDVENATSTQLKRLAHALDRFSTTGLKLPDLEVRFASHEADCNGHSGWFTATTEPWRISICSETHSTYVHELAHAWERANLTDLRRERFMGLRGYTTWADRNVPWNQRGMEGVAFIIQQGLSGLPLPPALSHERCSRLEAFRFLTGIPDPRLDEWTAAGHHFSSCPESVHLQNESTMALVR